MNDDVDPVLRAARRQPSPLPEQSFIDELEARLLDGDLPTVEPVPRRRRSAIGPVMAVAAAAAAIVLLLTTQGGGGGADKVRTLESPTTVPVETTTTTSPTTSTTAVPAPTTSSVPAPIGRPTVPSPTTTTTPEPAPVTTTTSVPSQQWTVRMSCSADTNGVVTCTWDPPPVEVAEWHAVRRHTGENEVGIPTAPQDRRLTDPTASAGTTYTYVVNGKDRAGNSVALGSATVTTPG